MVSLNSFGLGFQTNLLVLFQNIHNFMAELLPVHSWNISFNYGHVPLIHLAATQYQYKCHNIFVFFNSVRHFCEMLLAKCLCLNCYIFQRHTFFFCLKCLS